MNIYIYFSTGVILWFLLNKNQDYVEIKLHIIRPSENMYKYLY